MKQPATNPQDVLAEALPDLALLMHRNGTVLARLGDRSAADLQSLVPPRDNISGNTPRTQSQSALQQLVRKAIASRGVIESELIVGDDSFEAHVTAIGPEQAVCVIRAGQPLNTDDPSTH